MVPPTPSSLPAPSDFGLTEEASWTRGGGGESLSFLLRMGSLGTALSSQRRQRPDGRKN